MSLISKLKNFFKKLITPVDPDAGDILVTKPAIDWITSNIRPICAPDFLGYFFMIDEKANIAGLLTYDGIFSIVSTNPKKQGLSKNSVFKWYRKLFKTRFLEQRFEPFEEDSIQYNVPIDETRLMYVSKPILVNVTSM